MLYIETDLPGMLATKRQVFEEIVQEKGMPDNPNHHFMELNAMDPEAWGLLGETYFPDRTCNIAVINEGLLGYLSREEKTRLRDNIAEFFRTYTVEGAWISPDFANLPGRHKSKPSSRRQKRAEKRVGRLYDRFDTRDEVVAFLEAGGFRTEFLANDVLRDRMTCIPELRIKPIRIDKALHQHQALVARLA
jgi:O-methyltransferase involved in polyketide biosynthesis